MKKVLVLCVVAVIFIIGGCGISNTGHDHKKPKYFFVYVTNEGNFSQSNGSIFGYNPRLMEADSAYKIASGHKFYGYIQSANIINGRLYIVSNNPNKIEIIALNPLRSIGTIKYSKIPTFIAQAGNGKAYVTNLYDSSVSVVNLKTGKVTDATIPVGPYPYFAYYADGKVFVSNEGSSGSNNTISVIDAKTNSVVKTLTVGMGPNQIVEAPSGRLWVICQGKVAYDANYNRVPKNDVPGSIYIIDPQQTAVVDSIETGGRPQQLAFDAKDSRAYVIFSGGDVSKINMNTLQVMDSTFINRSFDAIGYSSNQQLLYLAKSRGYVQPGKVIQYNLQGAAVDSFKVGISPIGFQFVVDK